MSKPKMWPRELSPALRQDPLRQAEVRVFDALEAALPGGWNVFYSRPWLGITATGQERDGECDFVVAHAEHGMLAIEVKGGGISYDPATGIWKSRDRNDHDWVIKNPVEQAMKSKHALLQKIKDLRGWPSYFVRFRHGVVFPDAKSPQSDLGADKPKVLFCCRPELANIRKWVEARLSGDPGERGPGTSGMAALENVLAKPFMLRVPLGHRLEDDDAAIEVLTPQQFHILDTIADIIRAAAGGGAGTGKTIVACEDARRQAESGKRTLLTCRGLSLAAELRRRFALTEFKVDVLTFEELCALKRGPAGLRKDEAEILMQAAEADPQFRYDAIIVDEAQDFHPHWWIALDAILAETDAAQLHAYYDSNQQLYGPVGAHLRGLAMVPVRLTRNLRNTRTIHAAASEHYNGPVITAEGPPGMSIERHPVAEASVFRTTRELVRRLIGAEDINPADIAVLTPDAKTSAALTSDLPEKVLCTTIMDFKGLERSAVVVVATRAITDQKEMAYVALSRARSHLIVIGEAAILDWLAPLKRAA